MLYYISYVKDDSRVEIGFCAYEVEMRDKDEKMKKKGRRSICLCLLLLSLAAAACLVASATTCRGMSCVRFAGVPNTTPMREILMVMRRQTKCRHRTTLPSSSNVF